VTRSDAFAGSEKGEGDVLDSIVVCWVDAELEVNFDSVIDPERAWQARCREVVVRDVAACDAEGTPNESA
jgi:hypothetical protein